MIRTLRAENRGGEWRLSVVPCTATEPEVEQGMREAIDRGRNGLLRMYEALKSRDDVWALEFTKGALGIGEVRIGLAEQLADMCVRPNATHCEIHGPVDRMLPWIAAMALRERGLPVHGFRGRLWRDRVRFMLAALLALFTFVFTLLSYGRERHRLPPGTAPLLAVHGEWSTRTRHVLHLLQQGTAPGAIVVLGRPKARLESVAAEWKRNLGVDLPPLVRPFSVDSFVRGFPVVLRQLSVGLRESSWLPYRAPWRGLVAAAYRVVFGAVSSAWWRRQERSAPYVVYGHTGTADTTMLELAQQVDGIKTVHTVHGVSAGINFIGRSSVANFTCAADARWHDRLGGYGECRASVAPRPEYHQGIDGVLLLTNLAHPMNLWYRVFGIRDELRALRGIVSAVREVEGSTIPIRWKPHPVFVKLPVEQRRALIDEASELGMTIVEDDITVEMIRDARWVVCTPSTVVIEALRSGELPLVFASHPMDPDSAIGQWPASAHDAASMRALLVSLDKPGFIEQTFEQAWQRIGPAVR